MMEVNIWGPILSGFTILGVFLTLSAWINGRSIRRYIGELIKEESRASRELMDEGFKRMDEGFRRMDEGLRRMDEGLRRMDEGLKLIARLIVEENERTRKEIIQALKS